MNYYNEIDPEKAEWIRELIKAGVVAPGDVDERSIADVQPNDLRGYTQCHFFAGIAVWSYALRLAGWSDDRAVWTGSCPCPSFSCAGKGEGFADPRHLWPEWYRLIRECRPRTVFGEQVAAAIGHGWLDLVCGDMEAEEYAIAQAILGAHSAGAPHIWQRLYFCADTEHSGLQRESQQRCSGVLAAMDGAQKSRKPTRARSASLGKRTDPSGPRCEGNGQKPLHGGRNHSGQNVCAAGPSSTGDGSNSSGAGFPHGEFKDLLGARRRQEGRAVTESSEAPGLREWRGSGWLDPLTARSASEAGATRGFWSDCDWWYGRDGKYRPIGPGLFPLASKSPARVLRLRGYGDAICAESAAAFIGAYSEARGIA